MKKLLKISSYILATVMVFLISQFSVFAAGDAANNDSSLSGLQVVGGLAVLLLVILLPIMKASGKRVSQKI
jgi:hypothetical protein